MVGTTTPEPEKEHGCNWSKSKDLPALADDEMQASTTEEIKQAITEEEALALWDNVEGLKILEKKIKNRWSDTSNIVVESIEDKEMSLKDYEKLQITKEKLYEEIRNSTNDVQQISENTGISPEILEKIKKHVFYDEHILNDGIKKFPPDMDMANAWLRLQTDNFVQSDLIFLLHEYAESLIMQGNKISWDQAHRITDKKYNWNNLLKR